MRYIKIFLLTSQHVFEYRERMLVWFLISFLNPLLLVLFWTGATIVKSSAAQWNFSTIVSYYMLLTVFDSVLMCHIEEDIWRNDVLKGDLAGYLLKPISYFWKKFLEEFPYRIFQGSFALVVFLIIILIFRNFPFAHSLPLILCAVASCVLALFLSFTFKTVLGLISLWITQANGFFQLFEITIFVLGGYVVPLFLLPHSFAVLAYILPFSYIVYFPLIITQGMLSFPEALKIIGIQICWIVFFGVVYKILWKNVLKKFTAIGR